MTKKTFDTVIYSILAIGAFVVEFLPISIICMVLLNYQGIRIFFEVLEDDSGKNTRTYFIAKGIFLLLILTMLVVVMLFFMYRNRLLFYST